MQQALTSPVARAVLIGGLLLAVSLSLARTRPHCAEHKVRLVLHTVTEPDTLYLTWWRDGDVRVALEPGELVPLRFTTRAWVNDGCLWKGTETLEPIDAHHYAYRYEDRVLRCRGADSPYITSLRTGFVTVVE
jgi:hypothetical protein